jgi:bacillopeptidase F
VQGTVKVNLTWTASSSSQTTGYEIFRSTTSGSGYTSVGTKNGTSFTDSSVTFSTRYYYVVQSSRNSWRSVNSNEDPVTTPNLACVGGSDT